MAETTQVYIKIRGSFVSPQIMTKLGTIEVESTLGYPDMCTIEFIDKNVSLIDTFSQQCDIGDPLEVQFYEYAEGSDAVTVFKGEVTSIAPEFRKDSSATWVIKGYDKRHRLMRGTRTESFINVTDSDIIQKVASTAGLSVNVEATNVVRDHVLQDNQSDMDFIHQLARRNGYQIYFESEKLYVQKPTAPRTTATLQWLESLTDFRPRLSAARQVQEVTVQGWDPVTQKSIVGKKSRSKNQPEIGISKNGIDASSVFGTAQYTVVRQPVIDAKDADTLAQAVLDKISSEYVEADGIAVGNPAITAGSTITIQNVGEKFSGKYHVTQARHYLEEGIYKTEFRVEGATPYLLGGILDSGNGGNANDYPLWTGVYPAIVTNNDDPEKQGRVKVKYPWFNEKLESYWARIVLPGAGNDRGSFWLPQIDDEVLVAFEHGNFNVPYVLGGVYSQKKKPVAEMGSSEFVDKKVWKSEQGHLIIMDDTGGQENIKLETKSGHSVLIDDTNKKIETKTSGGQSVTIDGNGNSITIKGAMTIKITGDNAVEIKGNSSVKIEGAMIDIKGSGKVSVSAPLIQLG